MKKNNLKTILYFIVLFLCLTINAQTLKVSHFPGKNTDGSFTKEWVKVSTFSSCFKAVDVTIYVRGTNKPNNYKYKFVINNADNYPVDFNWKWKNSDGIQFGYGGSLGTFSPGSTITKTSDETSSQYPSLELKLRFEFPKEVREKYGVSNLSRILKCSETSSLLLEESKNKKKDDLIGQIKKLGESKSGLEKKIKLYQKLEKVTNKSYSNQINSLELEIRRLTKDESQITDLKNQINTLGSSIKDLEKKKNLYQKLNTLDSENDYTNLIQKINKDIEALNKEEEIETVIEKDSESTISNKKKSEKKSVKKQEEEKREDTYVYLKSPSQLLKEAETDLLTINDPLKRKQKKEQISFLRQSSINVARARGDNLTATELQIKQDNEKWENVSESAGNMIGGLIVNALQRRDQRRREESRRVSAASKPYKLFPKFVFKVWDHYFKSRLAIDKKFRQYRTSSINEQKQKILQYIVATGNNMLASDRGSDKDYSIGQLNKYDKRFMYVAEQKIKRAYFKNETLFVEFTREVKDARFDHPFRYYDYKKDVSKLKHFNIKKYKINGKVSLDYTTGKTQTEINFDWGSYKKTFRSLEEYKKFARKKKSRSPLGTTSELLMEQRFYTGRQFLDFLVIPYGIDGLNKKLTASILGIDKFKDENSFTNECVLLWNKGFNEASYEALRKAKVFVFSNKFNNKTIEELKENFGGIKTAKSVKKIYVKDKNSWRVDKLDGKKAISPGYCFNVKQIFFENQVDQATLEAWSKWIVSFKGAIDYISIDLNSAITEIPESILKMSSLKKLQLNLETNIVRIPKNIIDLIDTVNEKNKNENLKILLHVNSNSTSLPVNIDSLYKKTLCNLWNEEGTIGYFNGFKNLRYLPESLGNLKDLENLSFKGNNSLVELPASIINLTNLERLNLNKCSSLQSLPHNLETLKNLKSLYLDKRNKKILRSQVKKLKKKKVYISYETWN